MGRPLDRHESRANWESLRNVRGASRRIRANRWADLPPAQRVRLSAILPVDRHPGQTLHLLRGEAELSQIAILLRRSSASSRRGVEPLRAVRATRMGVRVEYRRSPRLRQTVAEM